MNSAQDIEIKHVDRVNFIENVAERSKTSDITESKMAMQWSLKTCIAALALTMTYTGSQMPLYFVAGPLSYILSDTGAGARASWIPVSYTLAAAIPVPFGGYLQDIFGRRVIVLCSSTLVIIGAILIGTAHSFPHATAGATLAGFGAGIAELSALAGINEIVPIRARGYSSALMTAVALPLGPYVLYAQLLATKATWRWGMWITCIYQGITVILLLCFYFPTKHSMIKSDNTKDILKKLDFVGGGLLITGSTTFLVALQSGGNTHAWSSAYVLCCLLFGAATLAGFVIWEVRIATYPVFPRELFNRRVVQMAFLISFVAGMNFYSLTNFGPVYFSNVYSSSPTTIGVRNIGFPTACIVGAVMCNTLISRYPKKIHWFLGGSCVLMTTFAGGLIAGNPHNPRLTAAFSTLAGLGVGGLIVPASTVAIIASPDDTIATTAAWTLAIRVLGGTIGYSIYYNIFVNKLQAKLPALVAEYAISAGLPIEQVAGFVGTFLTAPAELVSDPNFSPMILASAAEGMRWAYSESLKYVFITSVPFGVLAICAAFYVGDVSKYMTDKVVANLH